MKELNVTDFFLQEIINTSKLDVDGLLKHQVKRVLLDYVGATLAGAKLFKTSKQANPFLLKGIEYGISHVIGYEGKTSLENAIFLNGIFSHIAELDDGVRFGGIHPGGPIISCLLPAAEVFNSSVNNFMKGVIIGYETAIRLANSIHPGHYKKGFHPTSTCGSIGAAVGLAVMLQFDPEQIKSVFSAAVISASGSLKILEDASDMKPYNVGRAAVEGYFAVQIGGLDFVGPDDVLGGKTGFFSMFCSEIDNNQLLKGKIESKDFAINQVYVKPYAACRHAHAAIEATKVLRDKYRIDYKKVSKIEVFTYDTIIGKHDHVIIEGVASAKMSIPYSVAVTLVKGEAGINEFDEKNIADSELIELTKKVAIIADPKFSAMILQKRPARVKIFYSDKQVEEQIDFPKGEPETKLSDEELSHKYRSLSTFFGLSKDKVMETEKLIWNLNSNYLNINNLLQV